MNGAEALTNQTNGDEADEALTNQKNGDEALTFTAKYSRYQYVLGPLRVVCFHRPH
jgi:hypothetical protein